MPAILFVAGLLASAFVGGVTLGPRVTATLGERFVAAPAFTLGAAVVALAVTGVGILLGNLLGVSVSTTGTAVGAVVGLGVAADAVRWGTVGSVARWWVLSAVVAFWLAALTGRYAYPRVVAALERRSPTRARRVALVAAVPASLAVTTTMCVVGLGWGRASRVADGQDGGGAADRQRGPERDRGDRGPSATDLYDAAVTRRVVVAWVASPAVAAALAFVAVTLGRSGGW
jgi:phosphate/sulfate permease